MANEIPNRVHAGGVFVTTSPVPPPFTSAVLAAQGVQSFQRLGVGQYLLTLQRPLAFSEGYAVAGLPANYQAVAGAQISPDGTTVLVTVLNLALGVPVDPPIVTCTVWAVREGEGQGPALPFPPIPPPIPGGLFPGFSGVAPPDVAVASAVGSSGLAAQSDHTHGHGAQPAGAGTDHALVTLLTAGFMSPAMLALLNSLVSFPGFGGAPPNVAVASAAGSSGLASQSDHTHGHGPKTKFFLAETNSQDSSHRVRAIGSAGNFDFNFLVPPDFTSLLALEMWGASRTVTDLAASITATSSYGVPPAAPDAVSVAAPLVEAFAAGTLFTYSIAAAFAGLAASAQAAVNILHNGIGGTLDYYGILMVYE